MVPLSIIGMPTMGNPSFPLCPSRAPGRPAVVCARWVLCAPGGLGAQPRRRPACGLLLAFHTASSLMSCPPSRFFLRPQLLTRCTAPVGAETLC